MNATHTHRMMIESPNGTKTVRGECACGYARDYLTVGPVFNSPYEEGGYYRPQPSVPRDKLAEELAQ